MDSIAATRRHAQRYPFTLTVVPRSPANAVGAGAGQCPLDALDAANECGGCGRLPREGCRCATPQLLDVFAAREARRVVPRRGAERRVAA